MRDFFVSILSFAYSVFGQRVDSAMATLLASILAIQESQADQNQCQGAGSGYWLHASRQLGKGRSHDAVPVTIDAKVLEELGAGCARACVGKRHRKSVNQP